MRFLSSYCCFYTLLLCYKTRAEISPKKEQKMNTNNKVEIGTKVYSRTWCKNYTVAEINPDLAETDSYIILESPGNAPWYCNKKDWERLLRNGSTVIQPSVADTPMTEHDVMEQIQEMMGGIVEITSIRTFEDAMMLTMNKGLVIKYDDGTEFQLTIVRSR